MVENEFGIREEDILGIFKELEVIMNTNTDFDKIGKVLSKITGKELKSFVRVYSYTHDDFATALVEKYWKPERGNYKEMCGLLLIEGSWFLRFEKL